MTTKPTEVVETPETDAAVVSRAYIEREMDVYAHEFVLASFARGLEIDLAAAVAELEERGAKLHLVAEYVKNGPFLVSSHYNSPALRAVDRLMEQLSQATAKIKELEKYASHKPTCAIELIDHDRCTCGLEDLMK